MDDILDAVRKYKLAIALSSGGCGLFIAVFFVVIAAAMIILGLVSIDDNKTSLYSNYGASECGFTISSTSLSKEQYVSKLTEYAKNHSKAKVFADNASSIYDLAVASNVNPELVIVRAAVEGYSPGKSKNNYWGIGCYNGRGVNACKKYSSFLDGVKGFVDNIKKYSSLKDMMSKYAYIGDYWYNPGSSSDGGCYYYPYIKDYYDSNSDAQSSKQKANNACDASNSGKSNVKTTKYDQDAYAAWQIAGNMTKFRKDIFGLDDKNEICANSNNNVIDGNSNIDYSKVKLTNNVVNVFREGSFDKFLKKNGSSRDEFNKAIFSSVKKAGAGTREGVGAAAITAISNMANYGYRFRYSSPGFRQANYGVRDNIGGNGRDCSGFVSWAIYNGGFKYADKVSGGWGDAGPKCLRSKSSCEGKVGDLIWHQGHIMLIAGVSGNDYYIAHAANPNAGILLVKQNKHTNMWNSTDYVVDMSSFYSQNKDVKNYP